MKETRGNRLHIGFFGRRNVGKSSLLNKITGQKFSIVSDVAGTTTDVNQKAMEFLPIGPVVFMDTAGIDDVGSLGVLRVAKTDEAMKRADIVVMVYDNTPLTSNDKNFLEKIKKSNVKVLAILNKIDIGNLSDSDLSFIEKFSDSILKTSLALDDDIVFRFKNELIKLLPDDFIKEVSVISDLISKDETAVLVIPIDKEAPRGRIILPQVNVLRNLLDFGAISIVCTDIELKTAMNSLKNKPKIVITDSQVFKKVAEVVPEDVMLTSFSILFAKLKGDLQIFINGANSIDSLCDNDKVLILESCTHHPVEDDIGRVKIPNFIKKYTNKKLVFENYAGHDFPNKISEYSLIIHCGGCMTNKREILNRIDLSLQNGIPITNYGIAIAKCLGILERATKPFVNTI